MVGLGGILSASTLVASEGLLHSVELSGRQGEACSLGPLGAWLIPRVTAENLLCAIYYQSWEGRSDLRCHCH